MYVPIQLERTVHCNFTGDGKFNERGWACTPHPHQPRLILPSWLNVRQKAAVATLCTLWARKKPVDSTYVRTYCTFMEASKMIILKEALTGLVRLSLPELRIHDIFVWIRIRGSMPLTNESGSGSFYFYHWPTSFQQKTNLFLNVFLHITFWRYF